MVASAHYRIFIITRCTDNFDRRFSIGAIYLYTLLAYFIHIVKGKQINPNYSFFIHYNLCLIKSM